METVGQAQGNCTETDTKGNARNTQQQASPGQTVRENNQQVEETSDNYR